MGFPSTAFEKAWRNSKDEVADFLQTYHDHNYLVINVVSCFTFPSTYAFKLMLYFTSQNDIMTLHHCKRYLYLYLIYLFVNLFKIKMILLYFTYFCLYFFIVEAYDY